MAEAAEEHAMAGAAISEDMSSSRQEPMPGPPAGADEGNKFQQAIAAWRTLDLASLVSSLDTAASELVGHQTDSLVQRKELAQKTKDFRKLEDGAKLGEIKDLLKAYQGYIDVLSNHNKSINAAFMKAYSPLSEAPDPYPLLEASIDSLVTAEEVTPRLEAENERLQKQVNKLNSQLEDSEQRLEAERAKRRSFQDTQDTKLKEVEASWSAVLKEKEDNWAAKESHLEEKVESQDRLLKELKASYEVSQRLEKSGEEVQDAGINRAARAELEIANSDLERANSRLVELESRNEQMRLDLAQSASQAYTSGQNTSVEDDPSFLRLRSENTSLLRRLESSKHERESETSSWQAKVKSAEREVSSLQVDRDSLEKKVQRWSDYNEVKRELEVLRAIEFASTEGLDASEDRAVFQSNGTTNPKRGESLEELLLARNKKLSNELTELRVAHNEMQKRLESLQEDLSIANMELEKSRSLSVTLENDLQKTQREASNAFETMSVAGTWSSRHPKSMYSSRRGGGTSPTSSIIGGFDSTSGSGSPKTLESLRAGEAIGGGSGILPMVTAQRDRFKKKIGELELELQKQYQAVSALREEVASLQKDNLSLYEKTRYVSTYNRSPQPAASGASYGASPNPSTIAISDGPSVDRYRTAYESNISPFAAFRGRESSRAMKRMSLPERAFLRATQFVLATRTSRNLLALYCFGLHVLVLSFLFSSSATAAVPEPVALENS